MRNNKDLVDMVPEEVSADVPAAALESSDLGRMRKALGGKNIPAAEIAKKFIKQEEHSFNLFQTVSELKNQVENTEMQLFDL